VNVVSKEEIQVFVQGSERRSYAVIFDVTGVSSMATGVTFEVRSCFFWYEVLQQ